MNVYKNKTLNGIKLDMMGNYHGGCRKSCCQNSWGYPTKKGLTNNCNIKLSNRIRELIISRANSISLRAALMGSHGGGSSLQVASCTFCLCLSVFLSVCPFVCLFVPIFPANHQ